MRGRRRRGDDAGPLRGLKTPLEGASGTWKRHDGHSGVVTWVRGKVLQTGHERMVASGTMEDLAGGGHDRTMNAAGSLKEAPSSSGREQTGRVGGEQGGEGMGLVGRVLCWPVHLVCGVTVAVEARAGPPGRLQSREHGGAAPQKDGVWPGQRRYGTRWTPLGCGMGWDEMTAGDDDGVPKWDADEDAAKVGRHDPAGRRTWKT